MAKIEKATLTLSDLLPRNIFINATTANIRPIICRNSPKKLNRNIGSDTNVITRITGMCWMYQVSHSMGVRDKPRAMRGMRLFFVFILRLLYKIIKGYPPVVKALGCGIGLKKSETELDAKRTRSTACPFGCFDMVNYCRI